MHAVRHEKPPVGQDGRFFDVHRAYGRLWTDRIDLFQSRRYVVSCHSPDPCGVLPDQPFKINSRDVRFIAVHFDFCTDPVVSGYHEIIMIHRVIPEYTFGRNFHAHEYLGDINRVEFPGRTARIGGYLFVLRSKRNGRLPNIGSMSGNGIKRCQKSRINNMSNAGMRRNGKALGPGSYPA